MGRRIRARRGQLEVVLAYLVAQDGLLYQPRVPIQADPGIAPAPHLRGLPAPPTGCAVVERPDCGRQAGLVPTHSRPRSVLGMEPGGGRSRLFKMKEPKYHWKASQPDFRSSGRRGGGDGGWR